VNLYAYAGNDPISYDDPFGLAPDTSFADDRARAETQQCIKESQTCAASVATLASDKNMWTISTGSLPGSETGEPSYKFSSNGSLAGGTITVEGDDKKYTDLTNKAGYEINYGTTLNHELAHVAGNIKMQKSGPITPKHHCDEKCALKADNAYRKEMGYKQIKLRDQGQ